MESSQKKPLTAGQTRALKLALDAIMLVLLVLMYKKQVISLSFHEIGGLALIGLFVIHHLLNARWIAATTRKLFSKSTPGMVRARAIVDALLLVSFLTVGITGILINKTLFVIHVEGNAKTLHYFSSALSVILMGVHLGLHADYLFGKVFKKAANKIAKIATAVVLAALVAFGGYSLTTTQFVSFLTAPLQAEEFSRGAFQPSGDAALDGGLGAHPRDISELPEVSGDSASQPPQDGESSFSGGVHGNGQGRGEGRGEGAGRGQGEGNATGAALLIAQYVSIITLFGAVTYGVVKLTGKRKRIAKVEIPAETKQVEP
jgi:hypothetical protein